MRKKCAGRPRNCRWIENIPEITCFNPAGKRAGKSEKIILTVDELEAIRLADLEGLYQEHAAQRIKVSRQTFGRIIASAHKKIAEALVKGKSILIEGGEIMSIKALEEENAGGLCKCPMCEEKIRLQRGTSLQNIKCPKCEKRRQKK